VCLFAPRRECHSGEPVHLFQSRNYKLCVSIGATANVLTVLDKGVGPNLIREMSFQKIGNGYSYKMSHYRALPMQVEGGCPLGDLLSCMFKLADS
jgi:hypothetical protein